MFLFNRNISIPTHKGEWNIGTLSRVDCTIIILVPKLEAFTVSISIFQSTLVFVSLPLPVHDIWENMGHFGFKLRIHLGPEYVCVKYFLSFSQKKKTYRQRKLRQTKCLLFNFWMIVDQNTNFGKLPSAIWLFLV